MSSAYGIKVMIYTPPLPPFMYATTQSNWVSTSGPYWMQVGWIYSPGWNNPRSYYEHCAYPCTNPEDYYMDIRDELGWGSQAAYEVRRSTIGISRLETWCAYIDNYLVRCQGNLVTSPVEVQALSESHHP